jgi:hypothetical protein
MRSGQLRATPFQPLPSPGVAHPDAPQEKEPSRKLTAPVGKSPAHRREPLEPRNIIRRNVAGQTS